ncbi:MAG TPA: glycosyltransferase family 25 protein [Gaiellaceae bacterium]|nr:glycosyltransferase family 25 protein [Gaiellaceae bacterium]
MKTVARALLPRRWRLRLWLAYSRLTPGAFRLRRAQPSLRRRLLARVELERRAAAGSRGGLARLSGARVINLRSRPDRLETVKAELARIRLDEVDVFEGIAHENGLLGCGLSHRACLEQMVERGWESMLVCEDDVQFLLDRRHLDVLVDAFLDDPAADVANLAYFTWSSRPYSRLYLRGLSVQTASCYVVKRRIAEPLLALWADSLVRLAAGGDRGRFAHDRVWADLQQRHVFLIPCVRAARQRSAYSDIQQRVVEYGH